jgi:hypothetical protein
VLKIAVKRLIKLGIKRKQIKYKNRMQINGMKKNK